MSKINMPDFLTKMSFTTTKVAKASFYNTCYQINISAGTLFSAFMAKVNGDPSFIKLLGFETVEHDYETNDGEILDNSDDVDLEAVSKKLYANQRNKEKYKGYCVAFDNEDDLPIIQKLSTVSNKKQYILELIRKDIAKEEN